MAEAGGTPTQYTEIAQASLKAMIAEKRLGDSEIRKAAKSKEAPKPPGIPEGVAEKVRGPESPDTAEGQLMTQASERVDGEQQQWDEISTISEKSRDARNTLLAYDQARQLALQGIKPKMTLTLEDVAGLTQTITQATGEINARSQKIAQERGQYPGAAYRDYEGRAREVVYQAREREIVAQNELSAILTQGQEINWQDKEAAMTQLQSLKVLDADQRRLARELQRQMSSARTDRFAGLNRLAEYQSNRGFEGAADLQARLGAEQAKATATKINLPEILTDANLPTEDDVRREASGGIGKFMDSRAITDPAARERFQKSLGVYLAPSGEVVESQPTAPNALDTKTTPDLIDRGGLYDRFTQKQAIADALTKRWAEVMVAAHEDPSVLEQALTLDILRRVAQDALQAEQNALKRVYKGANRNALRAAKRELNAATNEKTGLENKAKATPRGWKVLQAASRVPQGLLAPLGFGGRLLQGIGSTAEKLSESADKIPQIVNASALEAQQARATQLAPDVATATTRAATAEANVKNLEALARGLDPAQTAADQQATAEQSRVVDPDQ